MRVKQPRVKRIRVKRQTVKNATVLAAGVGPEIVKPNPEIIHIFMQWVKPFLATALAF